MSFKVVQNKNPAKPIERILVISESDICGMAGIQGDIKTIFAMGGYAMTAITAIMAQHDGNICSIENINPSFVETQIRAAMKEGKIDGVKIGFLQNAKTVEIVAGLVGTLKQSGIPVVVDPSIVSRAGHVLADENALAALKRSLYIQTTVLTPNLKEAEILGVMKIADIDKMRHAADMMRTLGVENVVLKGGQAEPHKELYFVASSQEERIYERPTVETRHTLGAGAAFSSALAVHMARRMNVFDAVENALGFVHQAMLHSDGFNFAEGPIHHGFIFPAYQSASLADIKIYHS